MADDADDIIAASTADVRIVGTWDDAGPILRTQTQQLASAITHSLQAQVIASKLETDALTKLYTAADAEYAGVQAHSTSVASYATAAKEAEEKLRPALAQLDEIEKVVAELEGVAGALNTQSQLLEAAIRDTLNG